MKKASDLFLERERIAHLAITRAENWQKNVEKNMSLDLRQEQKEMSVLIEDTQAKNILVSFFDQSFRSERASRVVEQCVFLLKKHGIPSSFLAFERFLMGSLTIFGTRVPRMSLYFLKQGIFRKTCKVILSDEPKELAEYLSRRKAKGIIVNLNLLGELVLGEEEARIRFQSYKKALQNPEINYVSLKISNIYSQLHPLSYETSLEKLCALLSELYEEALNNPISVNGAQQAKFINLDMEEYKDIFLTYLIFMRVLEQKKFKKVYAGIVIQAYLPEAFEIYKNLLHWSKQRVKNGGVPIKIRLVKGANLKMEATHSALHNWPSPVLPSKQETDANYKMILETALRLENCQFIRIGVASHNLFDLSYALELAKHYHSENSLSLEMLEGIAEASHDLLLAENRSLILYAPVAGEEQFINGITYLIRRLDENTSPENFLRHSFGLKFGSDAWNYLERQFLESCERCDFLNINPPRNQDRQNPLPIKIPQWKYDQFHNEAETDFDRPVNYSWAKAILKEWQEQPFSEILIKIGKETEVSETFKIFTDPNIAQGRDTYKVFLSNQEHIKRSVEIAQKDPSGWRTLSSEGRIEKIGRVANRLRMNRGQLIGCMALVTGKTFFEGDNEVTEAIDFAEYYPFALNKLRKEVSFQGQGKGVSLVIAPWNFPVAIPAGGVLASLVSGNTVLLKPAPEAMPIAEELCRSFWEAGIPESALQIINCREGKDLETLVCHPAIGQIIFTGGCETVRKILEVRNDILVSAETGGKNAMIATALSDWDQVIADLVASAFSNTGQKCSAASLLILEEELFESPKFKQKLIDAVTSLKVGSAFELDTIVGPLISEPSGKLRKSISVLEFEEEWLVEPKIANENRRQMSPGIKWNTTQESYSYQEELFGPILSVMKAKDFEEALTSVNGKYGLTSGLESLDEREIKIWKQTISSGNLYVNRGITGAIVQRQPFGGFLSSESAFGIAFKAGGPNYLLQFMDFSNVHDPLQSEKPLPSFFLGDLFQKQRETISNYCYWMENYFEKSWDFSMVLGQDNYLRFLKGKKPFFLRLSPEDPLEDILLIIAAAKLCGENPVISVPKEFSKTSVLQQLADLSIFEEDEEQAVNRLENVSFIRACGKHRVSSHFRQKCAELGLQVIHHQPYHSGRLELPFYLQEQSISENYHRYGNLGFREKEEKNQSLSQCAS